MIVDDALAVVDFVIVCFLLVSIWRDISTFCGLIIVTKDNNNSKSIKQVSAWLVCELSTCFALTMFLNNNKYYVPK
mgnify:FL=1